MKFNALVVSVSAAIYSAGAVHAATDNTPRPLSMTFDEVKAFTNQLQQSQEAAISTQSGLNVQVNAQAQQFQEEGIAGEHVYIVRLQQQPVALAAKDNHSSLAKSLRSVGSTRLFTQGRAATRAVEHYRQSLLSSQHSVLNNVAALTGVTTARQHYTNALNGFSVKMTEQQAASVAKLAQVASVTRSVNYDLLSDQGPIDVGADKVWDGSGTNTGTAGQGEGQIIAVIDSGINSDHPSFADIGGDGYDHTNPWGAGNYVGDCVQEPDVVQCNDKLIGVRSYDIITDALDDMIAGWPAVGEDYSGHGSHVASTAAGNVLYDVPYMVAGTGEDSDGKVIEEKFFPRISGVAPHANLISYQACYPDNDFGTVAGCPSEALVAAIDDAIADGVDVINFSIGGSDKNVWADATQLAFLAAREAGISVAAAAGNSGSSVSCGAECFSALDNSSPWLAQVAATTSSREIEIETNIDYAGFAPGTGGTEVPSWSQTGIKGGALNEQTITGVVVWAKDYADSNGDVDRYGYCGTPYPENTFNFYKDGTPIEGAAEGDTNVIVVCARNSVTDENGIARTVKVDNVKAGGADAFIMFNSDADIGTVLASYSLPGVHLTREAWLGTYPEDGLEDWVDSTSERGHMITINKTVFNRDISEENLDWLAAFSSRGPSVYNPEVLAPSIAAPGVNIYAAYADEHPFVANPYGQDFGLLSGTSMASPHVAGALALVRQQQPAWSASEIQSALMMTANNTVQYHRLNSENGNVDKAEIYRTGSGRLNIPNAVQAGLVMDESAANFKAADPNNGGVPHKLNLPYLMNFSCQPECQWLRTVRATKDGTWEISQGSTRNWSMDMDLQLEQSGVDISFEPARFSLKAGETQTIIVKARVFEAQNWITNSEVEIHSELLFNEVSESAPQARWPMAFKYERGALPERIQFEAHENQGSHRMTNLALGDSQAPVVRSHALVKADVKRVVLPKDDDKIPPFSLYESDDVTDEQRFDESTVVDFIDVPENTSRVIAQVLDNIDSPVADTIYKGFPSLYIGKDYNGNGEVDIESELLCFSNQAYQQNFCNLQYPEAGKYWVVIQNPYKQDSMIGVEEQFDYAIAAVPATPADNASVEVVDAASGTLDYSWDIDLEKGDVAYSQITVGSSEYNPANLGSIPVRITRGQDRVAMQVSQTKANLGDQVGVNLTLQPNHTGSDRPFTIEMPIPEGMNINENNLSVSHPSISSVQFDDAKVIITGSQPDSSQWQPEYIVTDNVTDEFCKTPNFGNSNPGGYVDLSEFGINPALNGFDEDNLPNFKRGWAVPTYGLSGGVFEKFSLYNNLAEDNLASGVVQIRGNGQVDFSNSPYPVGYHRPLPYNAFPYQTAAALWRGQAPHLFNNDIMSVGLSAQEGISVASTQSGWVILEWDNASDFGDFRYDAAEQGFTSTRRDNSFDFELMFSGKTDFAEHQHEIYFAYDNIDFGSTDGRGVAGVQGYKGMMTRNGPVSGFLGNNIIDNNVDEVISDGYVVCLDYRGPESSQYSVDILATVPADASGKVYDFIANVELDGQAASTVSQQLAVDGNISIADIADMSTPESTAISFDVLYADELNTANEIIIDAENVVATVEGNNVTLQPAQDFHGDIEVTVTVADLENSSDRASTSFVLTVESDGVEPVQPEPEVDSDDSSSGSIAWYLLALIGVAGLRRKQRA